MSVHSRGLFKRRKRLSFTNPLTDEAEGEAAKVTDDRLKPVTDHGKGIADDRYSKAIPPTLRFSHRLKVVKSDPISDC